MDMRSVSCSTVMRGAVPARGLGVCSSSPSTFRTCCVCAVERADVVHFQWLDVQWLDASLLPRRPTVLTAHDLLPREPRPGQVRAQRRLYERVDAVVVHSDYGRRQLEAIGVPATVIHHGAFEHLTRVRGSLPPELPATDAPVVLFFGLLRPYKGLDTLLEAWRGIEGAELWIVGRPMISLDTSSVPGVRLVPRFVDDGEAAALFARADIVVLPYTRDRAARLLRRARHRRSRSASRWSSRRSADSVRSAPPSWFLPATRRRSTKRWSRCSTIPRSARPPVRGCPRRGRRSVLVGRGGA